MMEWQKIESAPKDGTPILGVVKGAHPITGKLFNPGVAFWHHKHGWLDPDEGNDHDDYLGVWELTHWMPLPAPPQEPTNDKPRDYWRCSMNTQALKAAKQAIQAGKTQPKRDQTKPATQMERDGPTPEQLANGSYDRGFIINGETNTKAMVERSSHDPVLRWERDKKLTKLQLATIERMQKLWHQVWGLQKITGSYSEPLGAQSSGGGCEAGQMSQIALRDELREIEALFDGLQHYTVFELICRFGMSPMEACGDRAKALHTVRFIADFIEARGS